MTEAPTTLPTNRHYPPQNRGLQSIGYLIFLSRWLQAPLYLGLIVAQVVYVVVFITELVHLAGEVFNDLSHINEAMIMLSVLGLIDVVMIANLLIMVIIGGYETFVSKIKIDGHPDQPEWLSHVNANVLKVKLAMAIIGISSIHLLKTFIEVGNMAPRGQISTGDTLTGESYTWDGVLWQVIIHMVFILSAVALAWIDKISRSDDHRAPSLHPAHLPAHADPYPAHVPALHMDQTHADQYGHPHALGQEPLHPASPERERA
jgi:uncharacterized protein (TIGR00645 family)